MNGEHRFCWGDSLKHTSRFNTSILNPRMYEDEFHCVQCSTTDSYHVYADLNDLISI